MLKVASYDVVFQEIPGEVTLALNLSGCPCHCKGCHSPHLWEDIGEELNAELLDCLMKRYGSSITCVAFMGGDKEPAEVARWAKTLPMKSAWYSGRMNLPAVDGPFDYVKIGPYIESLGGLKSEKTNQRLYKREEGQWTDITSSFWKKNL